MGLFDSVKSAITGRKDPEIPLPFTYEGLDSSHTFTSTQSDGTQFERYRILVTDGTPAGMLEPALTRLSNVDQKIIPQISIVNGVTYIDVSQACFSRLTAIPADKRPTTFSPVPDKIDARDLEIVFTGLRINQLGGTYTYTLPNKNGESRQRAIELVRKLHQMGVPAVRMIHNAEDTQYHVVMPIAFHAALLKGGLTTSMPEASLPSPDISQVSPEPLQYKGLTELTAVTFGLVMLSLESTQTSKFVISLLPPTYSLQFPDEKTANYALNLLNKAGIKVTPDLTAEDQKTTLLISNDMADNLINQFTTLKLQVEKIINHPFFHDMYRNLPILEAGASTATSKDINPVLVQKRDNLLTVTLTPDHHANLQAALIKFCNVFGTPATTTSTPRGVCITIPRLASAALSYALNNHSNILKKYCPNIPKRIPITYTQQDPRAK